MAASKLREVLSQFSLSLDIREASGKCTVVVNHQVGSSMYLANSAEEVLWLAKQSEVVSGSPSYTKYVINTISQ